MSLLQPLFESSFPAMLKVYLDNIIYRHVTFTYQEGRLVGALFSYESHVY